MSINLKSLGVSLEVGISKNRDVVACPCCLCGCRLFLHLTHLSGNDKSYIYEIISDSRRLCVRYQIYLSLGENKEIISSLQDFNLKSCTDFEVDQDFSHFSATGVHTPLLQI